MKEKCTLKANGLEMIQLLSHANPFNKIDSEILETQLKEHFEKGYAIVWLDNEVLIGQWLNHNFHFYNGKNFTFKYLQRLRVFNPQKEIYIWRSNSNWQGRIRVDYEGDKKEDIVMAQQLLFGTQGKQLNPQFAEISEKRGTKLILPLSNLKFDDKEYLKPRVFIKTHNYVKSNPIGQATYYDCRFVAFTDYENDLL